MSVKATGIHKVIAPASQPLSLPRLFRTEKVSQGAQGTKHSRKNSKSSASSQCIHPVIIIEHPSSLRRIPRSFGDGALLLLLRLHLLDLGQHDLSHNHVSILDPPHLTR